MTQGVVSIRVNGMMKFKIITGHDGRGAVEFAIALRELGFAPSLEKVNEMADEADFGDKETRIILESVSGTSRPVAHLGERMTDFEESDPDIERYFDTFHVAQFNPRWKYGTADYVEVVDL